MKTEYNNIHRPSLLYHIIEELVFLAETKKLIHYISNSLSAFSAKTKSNYKKLSKNEWIQGSLLLTGYMSFSSLLLFAAYQLVMIF